MKLSKSLLQAIAVGVTLGVGVSSCSLVEDVELNDKEKKEQKINEENEGRENNGNNECNCPGCGLG
jgi:hypothetical protein